MHSKLIHTLPCLLLAATLSSCSTKSQSSKQRCDRWHIDQNANSEISHLPWIRIETDDDSKSPSLVGRWQSDVMPSGYWVIDRFADGRYIEKAYHVTGSNHQIGLVWGRWKIDKEGYRHIIDGTNLPDYKRFIGKWKVWPVLSHEHNRFAFRVKDGDRGEIRISSAEPMTRIKMPHPTRSIYGWTPAVHGVVEQDLSSVPRWVRDMKP